MDTLETENAKPIALPESGRSPDISRLTLVVVITFGSAITLAWLAFLIWLILKAVSLL
jgi:hypothetical protein